MEDIMLKSPDKQKVLSILDLFEKYYFKIEN